MLKNRVKETTSSTGTGAVTPAGAVAGFRTFAASGLAVGDTFPLLIETAAGPWELSIGTWQAGGTIARVLEDSSTGALLNLDGSAGTKISICATAGSLLDRRDEAAVQSVQRSKTVTLYSSASITPPSWATSVVIEEMAGGGGGGGGGSCCGSNNAGTGGGGGGSAYVVKGIVLPISVLAAYTGGGALSVMIGAGGAGGAGGAASATTASAGSNGSTGGTTFFGPIRAYGGGYGYGGTPGANQSSARGGRGAQQGNAGPDYPGGFGQAGDSNDYANTVWFNGGGLGNGGGSGGSGWGGAGNGSYGWGCGGGGGGDPISNGNSQNAARQGGPSAVCPQPQTANPAYDKDAPMQTIFPGVPGAGGSGGMSNTASGGRGGNGGLGGNGAGGGGAGASQSGTGGTGGAGGSGYVRITWRA